VNCSMKYNKNGNSNFSNMNYSMKLNERLNRRQTLRVVTFIQRKATAHGFCAKLETRKSKTEAVLQRRSMLKLGVICKFIKRYGTCFMSWNVHLEFQVLCLGGVIFLSISGMHSRDQPPLKSTLFQLQVYAIIRPLK